MYYKQHFNLFYIKYDYALIKETHSAVNKISIS